MCCLYRQSVSILGRFLLKLGVFLPNLTTLQRDRHCSHELNVNKFKLFTIIPEKNSDKSIKSINHNMLISILHFGINTINTEIDLPTPSGLERIKNIFIL